VRHRVAADADAVVADADRVADRVVVVDAYIIPPPIACACIPHRIRRRRRRRRRRCRRARRRAVPSGAKRRQRQVAAGAHQVPRGRRRRAIAESGPIRTIGADWTIDAMGHHTIYHIVLVPYIW